MGWEGGGGREGRCGSERGGGWQSVSVGREGESVRVRVRVRGRVRVRVRVRGGYTSTA